MFGKYKFYRGHFDGDGIKKDGNNLLNAFDAKVVFRSFHKIKENQGTPWAKPSTEFFRGGGSGFFERKVHFFLKNLGYFIWSIFLCPIFLQI